MASTDPMIIGGDLIVRGTIRANFNRPSAASIGETHMAADATLPATILTRTHNKSWPQNGTAAAQTVSIHRFKTAGTIKEISSHSIVVATGNSTVTIDVKKSTGGGAYTTVLSAPIVLDNANVLGTAELGTLSVTAGAAGDTLAIYQTISAGSGTLPTGVTTNIVVEEQPT